MLKLPNKKRLPGMYLYCNTCKSHYSNDSIKSTTGKCKGKCITNNTVIYKAKIHIPGTKFGVKCKNLTAKNFDEALIEFIDFKAMISANDYQNIIKKDAINTPHLIIDCMALYLGFLRNEGVPEHKIKIRTEKHIDEVQRYFKYFILALKDEKYNVAILKFSAIDENIVGAAHKYILTKKHFWNKTYNKFMGIMRIFFTYTNETHSFGLKNPFKGVYKKLAKPIVETIGKDDFESLLAIIKPENGITIMPRTKERKSVYKPWLPEAYKLGLFTGRRREEIVRLRFSDIKTDKKGRILYIESSHLKVDRANNVNEEARTFVRISATKSLVALLYELGYDEYKGKDIYILAPDEKMERKTMMDIISKSFSHYHKQLGCEKNLLFKNLRKTYMTAAYKKYGEKARILTDSSSISVFEKNYTDFKVLLDANDGFDVFT